MRLIDRLVIETEREHQAADEETLQLLHAVTPSVYRRYLMRTHGFVLPVERALAATRDLERVIDVRRFTKHDLLRRDLQSFRMTDADLEQLPVCDIPKFRSPEQALGWAFVVERSTLSHANMFRHLASVMPGDVAFTSTYLKCYAGTIGEQWETFGDALEAVASSEAHIAHAIDAARTAFRTHRAWRVRFDDTVAD
ncbi:MAG TPA: biliverdin-producing heme oxygenase [Kofleriaceae bacterium]|nr:biliverdin-producing heme oxygenase [Kofleriaceae bacterium]